MRRAVWPRHQDLPPDPGCRQLLAPGGIAALLAGVLAALPACEPSPQGADPTGPIPPGAQGPSRPPPALGPLPPPGNEPVDGGAPSVHGPDAPPDQAVDGAPAAPPPVVCRPGEAAQVVADRSVAVGKTAGAAIVGCGGALPDVVWTQTAGPPVELLAARTQAISFDPPEPGTYRFAISYRPAAGGVAGSAAATITVVPAQAPSRLTVRSDQAVRELGNASVRAWPTLVAGEVMSGVSWEQLEGPAVKLDVADPRRIVFQAPDVDRDTVLRFRATVRTTAGAADSDDVVVVVENADPPPMDGFFARIPVSRVHPYRATGKYADRITACVFVPQLGPTTGCKLSSLPLIAQESPRTAAAQLPTVDEVMDRVLVSHDWLGSNFEQFLRTQDPDGDFRRMFGAVTAIVLGAHIRPPIYYGATGAIYLDGEDLWLTPAQRDLIDEAPDYRAGFGNGLTFSGLTRWTANNDFAWTYYRRDNRASRGIASITNAFGRVLFHELSHAADFFPPSIQASLDVSKTPHELYLPRFRAGQLPSSQLQTRLPLGSSEMKALGQVLFAGAMATDEQKGFQPAQVAEFFRGDRANDTYNYSTAREDLAMMVEEFMMAHRRGVRRDIAITNRYMTGLPSDQLLVAWGQRGRIGDPALRARIQMVIGQILPWIDPAAVSRLPPPIAMPTGGSWYATVKLPASPLQAAGPMLGPDADEVRLLEQELARRERHLLLAP
jgi:hypothetical protein